MCGGFTERMFEKNLAVLLFLVPGWLVARHYIGNIYPFVGVLEALKRLFS